MTASTTVTAVVTITAIAAVGTAGRAAGGTSCPPPSPAIPDAFRRSLPGGGVEVHVLGIRRAGAVAPLEVGYRHIGRRHAQREAQPTAQ